MNLKHDPTKPSFGLHQKTKPSGEALVRAWLSHIGEEDPEIIEETIQRCRENKEVRAFFLNQAKANPLP